MNANEGLTRPRIRAFGKRCKGDRHFRKLASESERYLSKYLVVAGKARIAELMDDGSNRSVLNDLGTLWSANIILSHSMASK
jgi:hypothetical protein